MFYSKIDCCGGGGLPYLVACVTDASRAYRTRDNIILSSLRGKNKNKKNNNITTRGKIDEPEKTWACRSRTSRI